jgi:adenylate kinase
MIVVVCGLSKCGKTSLVDGAKLLGLEILAVKGSTLLLENGKEIRNLTAVQALENQLSLLAALERIDGAGQRIVLDGHLLIETIDGPHLVSDSAFAPLRLGGVISVAVDAHILSKRREDSGFTTQRDELIDLMEIEAAHARRISRKHGVPHFVIDNDDILEFMMAATSCFAS